jgi:hypothetical protein
MKYMKTKNLLIAAFIMTLSLSARAQMSYGLRVGISSSNIKLENSSSADYKIDYSRGDIGYHFGVIAKLKIVKFFVQPELLFSTAKVDMSYTGSDDSTRLGRQVFNSLDLPIMVGIKLSAFKLEVGPVGTLLLSTKSSLLDEQNVDQDLNNMTIGYQAGIGVELGGLIIDAKYQGNLSKLGTGMDIGNTTVNFDQRMNQWIVSVGYLF